MKKLFLDVETTGLDPDRHAIIQLAMIIEIDGIVEDQINLRIRPFEGAEINARALQVNGIEESMFLDFMPSSEGYMQAKHIFDLYINPYDKNDKFLLYGYNPSFDLSFLKNMFIRNRDSYIMSYVSSPIDVKSIAVEYYTQVVGELPKSMKLLDMAEELNISTEGLAMHDALDDIILTRKIYQTCMKGLSEMRGSI